MEHIIHFHNGAGGGVYSVINKIVEFAPKIDARQSIYFLLSELQILPNEINFQPQDKSKRIIRYDAKSNFYNIAKDVAKCISDEDILVAHDWRELAIISALGLQNPVVFIMHGHYDYYFQLAQNYQHCIDRFVCITEPAKRRLITLLPNRDNDIFHFNFPVSDAVGITDYLSQGTVNMIFPVRNIGDENKYFRKVVEIASGLQSAKVNFTMNIVGDGDAPLPAHLRNHFKFHGRVSNETLLHMLPNQQFYIMPSVQEGLPVSMIEAMKAGIIPLVNRWYNGLEEIINHGNTGFIFSGFGVEGYISTIKRLVTNPLEWKAISIAARVWALEKFDGITNATDIVKSISSTKANKKFAKRIVGSRLDHPAIPNMLVKAIRNLR